MGNSVRRFLAQLMLALGRLVLVASIVLGLGYTLHYARSSPYGAQRFRVTDIRYEGTKHLDQVALDTLIRRSVTENLLQADLNHLRQIVEAEPWVKSAIVRRQVPNQILIQIEERTFAAVANIDNELYVVDPDGVILDRYGARFQSIDMPIVRGLRNVARENAREENARRMSAYLRLVKQLSKSPRDHLRSISEIDVAQADRVAVIQLADPTPIYLGSDQFLQRYETFLANQELYSQVKQEYGVIEYVDMSFENRIIFHTPVDRSPALAEGS